MSKPVLQDIIYNENRILEIENKLTQEYQKLCKIPLGNVEYRHQWLIIHHYELELKERRAERFKKERVY